MSFLIDILENGIQVVIQISENKSVNLLHCSDLPYNSLLLEQQSIKDKFRLVELSISGENTDSHHGNKHTGTLPGNALKYLDYIDTRTEFGRKIEVIQIIEGYIEVITHLQFFDGIKTIQSYTTVKNLSCEEFVLEYVSSFVLYGLDKEGVKERNEKSKIYLPHNTWHGENQWISYSPIELGLYKVHKDFSLKRYACTNNGTWSSCGFLPMGAYENIEVGTSLLWQIEHNGSWNWEISDCTSFLYLQLSGPTFAENIWAKSLKPHEEFESVKAAIAFSKDIFSASKEMTEYRRTIRRINDDNVFLPVIFNDYMNCLMGDPTEEKLIPIIDAAAECGCEYFCIDAGWYAEETGNEMAWWTTVGEWQPSKSRFPNGLYKVIAYIIEKKMVPGLWLEIEVMGINLPFANEKSDDWFFMRNGKRVIDNGRYQLDFRNEEVREYANKIMDYLVNEFSVGYIKMDYNINAGYGTNINSYSLGDGLFEHNIAYLMWIDSLFERYPSLIIENCGSGGMRMDYAMLRRHSIQSVSDQTDYRKFPIIASSSPLAVTMEQCAVWSYPLSTTDFEETIFNMVNAMLFRIHQSGNVAGLVGDQLQIVKDGITCYKNIRNDIKKAYPYWPIGLSKFDDNVTAFGLKVNKKIYLALWRLNCSDEFVNIELKGMYKKVKSVSLLFPIAYQVEYSYYYSENILSVKLPIGYSARLFEIELI